jgi:predicted metal-dependent phosphotriesterase family hydrolase
VGELQRLFIAHWNRHAGAPVQPADYLPPLAPEGHYRAAVASCEAGRRRNPFYRALLKAIDAAQSRVFLTTAYFVPTRRLLRVLAAAARVQRELGCAVSVHPAGPADAAGAMEAIRRAVEAGLDPARTAVDHVENRFGTDLAAIREVASRGFWLEVDCFGRECYYPHVNAQLPSDAERIRLVLGLLDAGLGSRLLFSQDICFKYELVRQGGHGYAHVLRTIRPRLLRSGVDAATVERILVDNPRRFLAGS